MQDEHFLVNPILNNLELVNRMHMVYKICTCTRYWRAYIQGFQFKGSRVYNKNATKKSLWMGIKGGGPYIKKLPKIKYVWKPDVKTWFIRTHIYAEKATHEFNFTCKVIVEPEHFLHGPSVNSKSINRVLKLLGYLDLLAISRE